MYNDQTVQQCEGAAKAAGAGALRVEPTRDVAFLDSVIRHPDVYGPSKDDASLPIDRITAAEWIDGPGVIALRVSDGKTDMGFFSFHPRWKGIIVICYIAHTCLLPNCRGALAVAAGKAAVAWMFTHTPAVGLISHCWETRPHVLWFAKRVGFVPRIKIIWPVRVDGARIFSTGVSLRRERWEQLTASNPLKLKL